MHSTKVVLNSFNHSYPKDHSLITPVSISKIRISNVHSSNNATGHLTLVLATKELQAFQIKDCDIDVPMNCIGLHFLADVINKDQELTFEFQLFE